jgi:hypothetical protein
MKLSTVTTHFRNWREWELNPVVVKELRQSVRSWAVTGMLLLFLTVLFVAALIFLVNQSLEFSVNQRLGAQIFQTFTVILTGASLLFIPLYVGVRLAAERMESNLDLLYVTALSPGRIIRGKFFCGAYMAVLFFSACMPFMVFTNLLRGVDLPTIFFILLCLFLAVCAGIQLAIFFACLPVSKLFKTLFAMGGSVLLIMCIVPLVAVFFEMMESGIGSMMGGREFWLAFSTVASLIFAAALLLYFLSVALIAPASANRALPLRIYLTLFWVFSLGVCLAWTTTARDARVILPWATLNTVLLIAALLVVISNHDELSRRVRRDIPAHRFLRPLAFVFYNGAAGGLVWLGLLLAATYTIASLFLRHAKTWFGGISTFSVDELWDFELSWGAILLYASAYALTALFLHRQFLARRSPKLAGILAILLPGAWALLPNIVLFFLNQLSWTSLEKLQLGNIFNLFILRDQSLKYTHVICGAIWLAVMLALNTRWFVRQAREFKPLDPSGEQPATAAPPPLPGGAGALES